MGQTAMHGFSLDFDDLKDDVWKQTQIIKEIATLKYSTFLDMIEKLNKIAQEVYDSNGRCLLFVVKQGSDSSLLWKGTVRIGCLRVNTSAGKMEDYKVLNLKQFLQAYKMLTYHINSGGRHEEAGTSHLSETVMENSNDLPKTQLSTSMILEKIGAEGCLSDMDECCICMERKPEVTLPCTHSYCMLCIEQWNVSHKTCPMCREAIESTDESWVIPEIPDSAAVNAELQHALKGLTDKLPEGE